MVSTRGRFLVPGGNPLHGSDTLDSRMGARRTAGRKQPFLFYILYVTQWWFRFSLQGHHKREFLDPQTPWTDVCDVSGFNNPSICSHSDDSGGAAALVPTRTPRSSGYDVYAHAVLYLYVFNMYRHIHVRDI
jgi:hypothetical protein